MSGIATLSVAAFDVLWDDLRLGAVPYPLDVPQHGATLDERARVRDAAHAELRRSGLHTSRGVDPELVAALGLLARPAVRVDALFLPDLAAEPVPALVAVRGGVAVRAVQRDGAVVLDRVRDTAVAAALVELLPAAPPGPGRSVTLPASALGGPRSDPGEVTSAVRSGDRGSAQARELAAILAHPVVRTGQFGVTRLDERGRPAGTGGVSWFDTAAGRYLNAAAPGRGGEQWLTVTPADAGRIAHRVGEVLAAV